MTTKLQNINLNANYTNNKRLINENYSDKPPLTDHPAPPLGNITSYFAKPTTKGFQRTEKELRHLRYAYKKAKAKKKIKIGKMVPRVGYCGTRLISKNAQFIGMVKGEKGGIYYHGMQRCGCVHFCPDCLYKLMKQRADELYNQLKIYKDKGKSVLFVTFTLQHSKADRLKDLHKKLLGAFTFANSHRKWIEAKKNVPVEYLRTLEVLYGVNGWHPHLHSVFIGDSAIEESINIFTDLYKQELSRQGLLINEHTVSVDKWNGKLGDLTNYAFKGMLEQELTGGGLKKSGEGKTFFELIDDDANIPQCKEYVKTMKGKRQYHHSKGFFKDVRVKTDKEILQDDTAVEVLFNIPVKIYAEIVIKGIALHLLNEYEYGGKPRAIQFLELYDVDAEFLE